MRTTRGPLLLTAVLGGLLLAPAGAHAATARGSVGEAWVSGATPRAALVLRDARGRKVAQGRADRFGSLIFRDVRPGGGYVVRTAKGARLAGTRTLRVLSGRDAPPAALYRGQKLHQGLNYVTVRDGISLAMTVRLPAGKTLADGPFPTLVEYSGYQTAAPHDLFTSITATLSGKATGDDPLAPASSTAVGSLIAPLLNFAVVSVQMRGSGCSGGAFDLFGLPTTYDGYDAIETVAAQSWVKGGKVGMAGISFSGITQLFTAGTRPPHLAAIAPMSVADDFYAGVNYPGGIRNSGFASSWVRERQADAEPAPAGGQPYARALVRAGDARCRANQRLRLQTQDGARILLTTPYRDPALYDRRSTNKWIGRITVPTFLVGQFQDEQTGGHFPEALGSLRSNPRVWLSLQNGVHADSLGPSTLTRWVEFLKLYVADEVPSIPPTISALSGTLYQYLADAGASPVLQSRFAGTTDVAAARRTFERDPRVRILMDNGAGPAGLGSIGASWELGYDAWPVRQAVATPYALGAGGVLGGTPTGRAAYVPDPAARPAQTLPGDGDADAWKAQPPYDWRPVAAGKGLGWTTPALAKDVVIAGPSSLDLRLASSARDTDLQVTLSEVRPDGRETYVQNGWLRASRRHLDARRSTAVDPVPTYLERDASPLVPGRTTLVRVPIFPVAHAFRAGSRIRVTVQAPGGDRPRWDFATLERGRTRNSVSLAGSRLVLPVVAGATAQGTPLPAPTALRGEPDRAYVAASNGG